MSAILISFLCTPVSLIVLIYIQRDFYDFVVRSVDFAIIKAGSKETRLEPTGELVNLDDCDLTYLVVINGIL
ncbi:MAG: hypothetical protein HKP41_23405 [Desulfobacterales bacterium]|nr:hypothetical protein [Desulfofustis sp.]NNF47669.1 hypothetical protein [Desulfofustis sp.]NNK97313.1 hypothetical protein [Desulfobacterales bacterium]